MGTGTVCFRGLKHGLTIMERVSTDMNDSARIVHQEPGGQVCLVEYEHRFFDVMTAHFGDRFKKYRQDWADSSQFLLRPDFPLSLDLEVKASCNLRCVMCVMAAKNSDYHLPGNPGMDLGLYRRLMDQARENRLPAMTFGFLSEPLLCPDIEEMIRLARLAGVMDIRLGTNGVLLTRETSRRLIQAGLTRLEVSLDAFYPETYARIRRGGRLENISANIMDFLEIRDKAGSDFPILRLSFLKLPHNEGELDLFLRFWRGRADLFSIQNPVYFKDAPISGQLDLRPGPEAPEFKCAQPWQRLIVRASGEVFPCCSVHGLDLPMGSARTAEIERLWRHPLIRTLCRLAREGRLGENRVCAACLRSSSLEARPRPFSKDIGEA